MHKLATLLVFLLVPDVAYACRSLPPRSERGDVYWSYYVNRSTGEHCWHPGGRPHRSHASREEKPTPKPVPPKPQEPPDTTIITATTIEPLRPPTTFANLMFATLAVPDLNASWEEPDDSVWPTLEPDPEEQILLTTIWPPLEPERTHAPVIIMALLGALGAAILLWNRVFPSSWNPGLVPRAQPLRQTRSGCFSQMPA